MRILRWKVISKIRLFMAGIEISNANLEIRQFPAMKSRIFEITFHLKIRIGVRPFISTENQLNLTDGLKKLLCYYRVEWTLANSSWSLVKYGGHSVITMKYSLKRFKIYKAISQYWNLMLYNDSRDDKHCFCECQKSRDIILLENSSENCAKIGLNINHIPTTWGAKYFSAI